MKAESPTWTILYYFEINYVYTTFPAKLQCIYKQGAKGELLNNFTNLLITARTKNSSSKQQPFAAGAGPN